MTVISTHIHCGYDNTNYFNGLCEFDNQISRQEISELIYNDLYINKIRPKIFELIEESSINVMLLSEVIVYKIIYYT